MSKKISPLLPATHSSGSSDNHQSLLAWVQALPLPPSSPGVYWFLDEDSNVLYVGKAKNLHSRINSYKRVKILNSKTLQLVQKAQKLKWKKLESELEALILEAELIRTYQPNYNILLKDDKSPLYIWITDETYPRVLKVRKKEIISNNLKGKLLGPFPSSYKVTEVLKIVRPIFPWCNRDYLRNYKQNDSNLKPKACFYFHLELCPGACTGLIDKTSYQNNIKQLTLFLTGRKQQVLKNLKISMHKLAENQNYEAAGQVRDRINLIIEVTQKNYRLHPTLTGSALSSNLAKDGISYLQDIFSQYLKVPKSFPLSKIEGFDVSNIQGTNAAVSQVVFIEGVQDTNQYRLYNIRSLQTPNDYQMLKEALIRRQNHPEWKKPNLVLIDGGKGQVRAALSVWQWPSLIIGLAKNPDRLILPNYSDKKKLNEKNKKITFQIIKLADHNPGLKLLQQIRNEAHRFAQKQYRLIHNRKLLK